MHSNFSKDRRTPVTHNYITDEKITEHHAIMHDT